MISAEWVSVLLIVIGGIIAQYKSNQSVLTKITTGQAVAKVREEAHDTEIKNMNLKLDKIMNGESKCKLLFTEKLAELATQSKNTQSELTEFKQEVRA